MGECGCGDGFGMFRFPGPDGAVYAFDIYFGCRDCDNGPGITIHRYSARDVAEDFACVQDIPSMTWREMGDYGVVAAPLLDPDALAADLVRVLGDPACDVGGETMPLSELFDVERELLWQAVAENMSRSFNRWLEAVAEARRRAS